MILNVYAERGGNRLLAGTIETVQAAGERFTYDSDWLSEQDEPLSASLPLQRELFAAEQMRPYFDGLLPEGTAREALAKSAQVSSRSYVKLLAALGDECIGAVSFQLPGSESQEGYAPLADGDLEALAKRAYRGTTAINKRTRMSLAGAQAKVGLHRADDGSWHEPQGGAPSTHILKPMNPRFENAQINEAICQIAAQKCGLPVPDTEIIPTEVPLFCVRRFDRAFTEDAPIVDGLRRPMRLHQEDLCQALGIVPERKYEEGGRHYLERVAQLVRNCSARPVEDLRSLWAVTAFNFLIGNCDAHLKNIAFVRDAGWKSIRLAPFYDLVCTTYYDGLSGSLAMSIGGKRKLESIDRAAFEREAESLHLSTREAGRVLDDLANAVPDALNDAAMELARSGHAVAASLGGSIAEGASLRAKALTHPA